MTQKRLFIVTPSNKDHIGRHIQSLQPGDMVRAGPAERSLVQNAKLHAMFADIARQELYGGRQLKPEQWKTLFISGHAMATGLGADMVPGLEGEFCNIRESSASMTIARMNSLIEYIHAWSAQHGVQFSDPHY